MLRVGIHMRIPRILLPLGPTHEHRSREAPFDATLPRWDADDELLEGFAAAAREHGLRLEGLWSRRPRIVRSSAGISRP